MHNRTCNFSIATISESKRMSENPAPKPAKVPTCSLCRVSSTEEHLASGWHNYNVRIFDGGKMPIPETNYNLFGRTRLPSGSLDDLSPIGPVSCYPFPLSICILEKPKEQASGAPVSAGASSAPASATALEANKRNVNAWHWEENDYTNWAKDLIKRKLLGVREETAKEGPRGTVFVAEVSKLSGDAYVNTRKGRTFAGYEFKASLEWTGEWRNAEGECKHSFKGKAYMPEISADVDDCDFEVANVKLEGTFGHARQAGTRIARFGKDAVGHKSAAWSSNIHLKHCPDLLQVPSAPRRRRS